LRQASARSDDCANLLARMEMRQAAVARYVSAYGRYCWPVAGVDDYRIAPFHLLATEATAHFDKDHLWHMAEFARLAAGGDRLLLATTHRLVDLADESGIEAATDWWRGLTEAGGEGMVVKPLTFIAPGRKGMAQPAIKCRGSDYLRIIYGAEYNLPENLSRLRGRSLAKKRSLASREFTARGGSPAPIHRPRAVAARARGDLRRPGAGERACRSEAVMDDVFYERLTKTLPGGVMHCVLEGGRDGSPATPAKHSRAAACFPRLIPASNDRIRAAPEKPSGRGT
jgi:PNKP adenylyltransferase domain, ligase domain